MITLPLRTPTISLHACRNALPWLRYRSMSKQTASPHEPEAVSSPTSSSPEAAVAYLARHSLHFVIDQLVRDVLVDKPADVEGWMFRWLMERHRQLCAERHESISPLRTRAASDDAAHAAADHPTAPQTAQQLQY